MSMLLQKTLCIVKPDGVRRGLIGDVVSRFERVGLKMVAAKMLIVDESLAKNIIYMMILSLDIVRLFGIL